MKDVPSVADTCMAALALVRSGSTPAKGEYAKRVLQAVEFVCGEIEESDRTRFTSPTRGTRVQSKLGPYIDTFMAVLLPARSRSRCPTTKREKRACRRLEQGAGQDPEEPAGRRHLGRRGLGHHDPARHGRQGAEPRGPVRCRGR